MSKQSPNRAAAILSWLVKMCAPSFDDTFVDGEIPIETLLTWIRQPREPLPFLAIDTSTSEDVVLRAALTDALVREEL